MSLREALGIDDQLQTTGQKPSKAFILKTLTRTVAPSIGLFVLYAFLPVDGADWPLGAGLGVLGILLIAPITVHNIKAISKSEHPVIRAVEALLLLASILITGFATIYYAYSQHSNALPAMHTRVDGIYFTVVTLGTVGYGDITPVGQGMRVVVTVQILLDLILIGSAFRLIGQTATRARAARTA